MCTAAKPPKNVDPENLVNPFKNNIVTFVFFVSFVVKGVSHELLAAFLAAFPLRMQGGVTLRAAASLEQQGSRGSGTSTHDATPDGSDGSMGNTSV